MQTTFDKALANLKRGDADRAAEQCTAALQENPADGKMRVLLATAQVRMGQFENAESNLREVISKWPGIPKANRELGNALLAQGKGDEAIEAFERVVDLTPDKSVAHFDLSMALSRVGREDDARDALEKSFELDPERRDLLEAMRLQRDGKTQRAEDIYRDVLRRDPTNVNATRLLGVSALDSGQHRLAVRLLKNAIKLAPEFFGARIDLARALIEKDDLGDAREILNDAIDLEPRLAFPRMLLGNLLSKAGQHEEAVTAFEKALELDPNNGGSHSGLGHALKTIGRQEEAIASYRNCVRIHPSAGEAYWSLANLKTFRFSDEEIVSMEKYVDDKSLSDETRVNFNFALGKAHEDRGDHERGFNFYSRGNSIRRENERYDPVTTEVIHDRIMKTISSDLLQKCSASGNPDPAPIFIVGLPRSGSTLVEQILASHEQVEGTHELPDLPRIIMEINKQRPHGESYPEALQYFSTDELAQLGSQYLDSTLRHRTGKPFFTDKMPNNFPSIGLLQLILPNAKIVNARRHPLDSCMGSYKQLFFKGQAFTYDLIEIGEYYLEYQRVMDYWHALLPGKILDVQYEEMVMNQENQTRRLIDFCGLPWDDGCLRFYETDRAVNTASSEQVRQPIYSKSVNSWRRFEKQLQPLIEVLEPLLIKLPEDQRPGCLL
jgi:tetratricopeptide (TPR) repeat protein